MSVAGNGWLEVRFYSNSEVASIFRLPRVKCR